MQSVIQNWKNIKTEDEILNKELQLKDKKIMAAFDSKMVFGTAGIRGVMGAGLSKMNVHTVAAAAEAYAKFLLLKYKNPKVIIGHDNRNNSKLFSKITAEVMQANGITAFLFENNDLQPTPFVSYTIRKMNLDGGVIITASHNPKEYNGFKVYNNIGGQLLPEDTDKISAIMDKINPLDVKKETWKEHFVSQELQSSYKKEILKLRQTNEKDVNVVFSAQHGTAAKLMPELMSEMGVEYHLVEKQQTPDGDFKNTKTPNPEDGKSFYYAEIVARKYKSDLMITTDPDADRLGVAVKYKRRYKFLNGNETAALYLEFMLSQLKRKKKLPKDGYIVKSVVSGNLAAKIAQKFGLKVYETHVGFKNIAQLIEDKNKEGKEKFVFGYEESYGFLLNDSIARDKDSLQAAVGIIDMVAYYKSQNINVFEHLKDLYKQFGVHRTTTINKKLDEHMQNHLLKEMTRQKRIGDDNVVEVQDYRKGFNGLPPQKLVKLVLKSGSWIAMRPSGTEPKVKVYVETVDVKKSDLMDVVFFEKQVEQFIQNNSEEFKNKKFSWKAVFKYVTFFLVLAAVMYFVFKVIYTDTQDKNGNSVAKTYSAATAIWHLQDGWIWLTIWIWNVVAMFISAWAKKRTFVILGEKVKSRHLVISSIMGGFIAYVTPFAVGGDAIGYWYLRRKGVKRGPLIAAMTSSTLIGEAKFTLQTAFLVGVGWPLYQHIFNSGDIQAHAALIWFFLGLSWSVFATAMIFGLTLNRRFQEFIVRNSIRFLEWFRWTHVYDPAGKAASYQYEFKSMRDGMKRIWVHKYFPFELLFYSLAPMFFNPGALIMYEAGIVRNDIGVNGYWAQIVANDIVGTANSMSITPGGSGTDEWLSRTINEHLFTVKNTPGISSPTEIATGCDLMWKMFNAWPWLLFSASLVAWIILIENRRRTVDSNNKLNAVHKNGRVEFTRLKTYSFVYFTLFIVAYLLIYFFVMFK